MTPTMDVSTDGLRAVNAALHAPQVAEARWTLLNPSGEHAIACGLTAPITVTIEGHVGYYCAGMNQLADVTITGNAASQSAGATAHGGLLVIDGNSAARCGISMKGVDIVVGGDVGHMSAFMGQAGRLVVCGDVGDALGDSLYEARLYVRGKVSSLGADCVEKPMRAEHLAELAELLAAAQMSLPATDFRRYGSARTLYNFSVDHANAY